MSEFLLAPQNFPFAVALAIMALLTVLEFLAIVFAGQTSTVLDGLLPELHLGDVDGSEIAVASWLDRFLGWLHFGKVPVLMLLALFLLGFGFSGLALQGALRNTLGFMLPGWMAALAVLPVTMPIVRVGGSVLAKVMPRDETQSVSAQSFIGQVATIVLGTARPGSAAQARLRDKHGQTHYVMVEPDEADEQFDAGEAVLIVSQQGHTYRVIRADTAALAR
jgi:hypothetical protein